MKMFLGNTQIKSMKVGTNTDDATLVASDLQAGVTGYARGRKVIGTGKSFEFANYGASTTNIQEFIPTSINVVEITSLQYPIKGLIALTEMKDIDFSTEQTIGVVVIDGVEYPIAVKVDGYFLTFSCEKTVTLETFYGKDNYI